MAKRCGNPVYNQRYIHTEIAHIALAEGRVGSRPVSPAPGSRSGLARGPSIIYITPSLRPSPIPLVRGRASLTLDLIICVIYILKSFLRPASTGSGVLLLLSSGLDRVWSLVITFVRHRPGLESCYTFVRVGSCCGSVSSRPLCGGL